MKREKNKNSDSDSDVFLITMDENKEQKKSSTNQNDLSDSEIEEINKRFEKKKDIDNQVDFYAILFVLIIVFLTFRGCGSSRENYADDFQEREEYRHQR